MDNKTDNAVNEMLYDLVEFALKHNLSSETVAEIEKLLLEE